MKSLFTLLKLAQRRLDELGVEAARIQQDVDGLRMDAAALDAREETEAAYAAGDPAALAQLALYRQRVRAHRAEIIARIGEREHTLALVRERLATAYQEKSKFEQLIEQEKLRVAIERAKAEQNMLDEVAITRARPA